MHNCRYLDANSKSYLGIMYNIDEETFEHQSYIFGCSRITGGYNFLNISKIIKETH